jgi:hypothetical protein
MPQVSEGMPAATIRLIVEGLTPMSSASSRASMYRSSGGAVGAGVHAGAPPGGVARRSR